MLLAGTVKIFFTNKSGKEMKNQNSQEIIYSLNVDDVQTVAQEEIDRELTQGEIEQIKDLIAVNIDWFGAISNAIRQGIDVK